MSNLPSQIRKFVRQELHGTYTVTFAIIEALEGDRRVEVSLKDDRDVLIDNIPVASPYTGDGYGEVYPISEGDEGLLLINKEPLDDLLPERGHQDIDRQRQHSFRDGVFFPRIWFDADTVPDTAPGDYLMAHESGTNVWIQADGTYLVERPSGMQFELADNDDRGGEHLTIDDGAGSSIRVDTEAEPDDDLEQNHGIQWPDDHIQIHHHSGIAVELTEDGLNISTVEDDTVGQERPEHTPLSHGRQPDPHRIEFQGHRHLVPSDDGSSFQLTKPPLSNRLLFDVLLGTEINADVTNLDNYQPFQDVITYYEDYQTWLEGETGTTLDPTMPRDADGYPDYTNDDWLDVEPVPDAETKDGWGP